MESLKEIVHLLSKSQGRSCTSQSLIESVLLCLAQGWHALVCLGTIGRPSEQPKLEFSDVRPMAMVYLQPYKLRRHCVYKLQAAAATFATWFATLSGSQKNMRKKTIKLASF